MIYIHRSAFLFNNAVAIIRSVSKYLFSPIRPPKPISPRAPVSFTLRKTLCPFHYHRTQNQKKYINQPFFCKQRISQHDSKNLIKLSLFSFTEVVGLPRFSLAPIEHFTSIRLSSFLNLAAFNAVSRSSKLSTLTAFE